MSVTNSIKTQRIALQLSQEELAEQAGVSLRTIQRIEKGETNPHGNTLRQINKVLNIETHPSDSGDSDRNLNLIINLSTFSYLLFPPLGLLASFMISLFSGFRENTNQRIHIVVFQFLWLVSLIGGFFFIRWYNTFLFHQNGNVSSSMVTNTELTIIIYFAAMYAINFCLITLNSIRLYRKKSLIYIPFWPKHRT